MTIKTHLLGYPRIGAKRELKFALESYWRNAISQTELLDIAANLRQQNWQTQADSGLDFVTTGDFSFYDHVLDTSVMLGAIPQRFQQLETSNDNDLDAYFRMARGQSCDGISERACAMTKWFDTNYHYLAAELESEQSFVFSHHKIVEETLEAQQLGYQVKPVLLGPLSWLWLATTTSSFDKLQLLDALLPVYAEILQSLADTGVEWIQIDEPILALDLPADWQRAFERSYFDLQQVNCKLILTTYFDTLGENTLLACKLPVAGLHIDLVRAPQQLNQVLDNLPTYKVLSLGIIDGRNIWRADLDKILDQLSAIQTRVRGELWLAPSCSLLHVPYDLKRENNIDSSLVAWLAFARQKLDEIEILRSALQHGREAVTGRLAEATRSNAARLASPLLHNTSVRQRIAELDESMFQRQTSFQQRQAIQQQSLNLPLFPTTTIGSFPQTSEIRKTRSAYRKNTINSEQYQTAIQGFIQHAIEEQEQLNLDVLVHGEAERNDMVEYFAEQLQGFLFTHYGWVQSYGSRCVKPPILYGDVSRPQAMTVAWIRYAQSLTDKPVKGMLTGPVTILNWSFVRDDQPLSDTALQIGLAIRDEVSDLEQAGINIIQIDEAALREGLPLRKRNWKEYLDWAIRAFRLSSSVVNDATQIHTHMCYSDFNDIIEQIAAMDADVITIETSRSNMKLLDAFAAFDYPNAIGPGVYDIHSPNIPSEHAMAELIQQAQQRISSQQLWINPDCGLKTRGWEEVRPALQAMVNVAQQLRVAAAV